MYIRLKKNKKKKRRTRKRLQKRWTRKNERHLVLRVLANRDGSKEKTFVRIKNKNARSHSWKHFSHTIVY